MSTQRGPHVQLIGSLDCQPETVTLPGRPASRTVYDPATDNAVVKHTTTPSRQVCIARLLARVRNEKGHESTCHYRLVDPQGCLRTFSQGDRVQLWGYFQTHKVEKGGQTTTAREFIVTSAGR